MRRRYTTYANTQLPDLPSDDAIVEAVRVLIAEANQRMAASEHRYYRDPRPTASDVAYRLGVEGARRLGNGAVKGSWTGTMAPALRLAPRLRSLARAGRLRATWDDRSRRIYDVPGEGWRSE